MAELIEQIVSRPQELPEVCAHLAASGRFAFDTEFVGEDTYQPCLCLVQAATEERLIVIDPISAGPLDEFWQLIVDPNHEVIVHAGREEIRMCRLWMGKPPGNLVDLQIAAGFVGLSFPLSGSALVDQVLGIHLPKTETLTEWRDRPLTKQQIRYAFDDVRYLLPMWEKVSSQLEDMGRKDWAREEFARLCQVLTDQELHTEKWRRVRGVGALGRKQLAMVRELFQWREEVALRTNRPLRTICRDDLLVEIVRRNPHRDRDLLPVRGIHHRDIPAILNAVGRARELPLDQCPEIIEREFDLPQVGLLTNLLLAVLGHMCSEMRLAANLVSGSHDLRLLARAWVTGEKPGSSSLLTQGWRNRHILPALEALLRGETLLRVVDPKRDNPFEFLPSPTSQ